MTDSKPLSQSAEGMTAYEFRSSKKLWRDEWTEPWKSITDGRTYTEGQLMEAFAEHRTAALTAELEDRNEQIKYASASLGGNPGIHLHDRIYHLKQAAESSAALVKELAQALTFIFEIHETYGDIAECPFEASTDHAKQVSTYRCCGCAATGARKFPSRKVEFTHAPNCKWVKAESLLSHPAVQKVMEK